ncbi:transporter substrate-binding domain-containing protein [Stakelama saccharophila]|uniref:Transporter substrate-binding domain-containing protein n=1 Tax=Stakelama saccharophila TaxID=3075605 RepID=A0ABZ0BDF9_9SPHN|nr:transporter substrate-binding domain-containing protein [Stakelama sp. W311]WNO54938.1 transporter substrate-binding domain-containing protein [Stakelama sp. W311]
MTNTPTFCRRLALLLITLTAIAMPAMAQDGRLAAARTEAAPTGELTIATREAPPFAMKGSDGAWGGLAINLWRQIAQDTGIRYHFEQTDLDGMVQGVADGRYDASVGALTVTPGREQVVDFTHPYYTTGFGIVTGETPSSWLLLVRNFFTWSFLSAVLLLAGVLLVVGFLFWLAERRHNRDEFGGKPLDGIGSGFWFSAVTMTTVGYGDKAPRTLAGRIIALVWMFAAIIIISTFTGLIASSLTEGRLSGKITGPDDLAGVAVGTVPGSAAEEWLNDRGVGFRPFNGIDEGLKAVRSGNISAFVYDRPLLVSKLKQGDTANDLRLVPATFGRQDYAFALPQHSAIREKLNRALLARIESRAWASNVRQVLGRE